VSTKQSYHGGKIVKGKKNKKAKTLDNCPDAMLRSRAANFEKESDQISQRKSLGAFETLGAWR